MDNIFPIIEIGENELPRVLTGIPKLDDILALKDRRGMPLSSIYEIYGPAHVGKSTLSVYLSARVNTEGLVAMVDLEGAAEAPYLRSILLGAGFRGVFRVLPMTDKGKVRPQEDVVQESVDMLFDEATAGIMDSLAFFTPIAEAKGDLTDAVMGRRAKIMASTSRRLMSRLRGQRKAYFIVNHQYDYLGHAGMYTPGGKVKEYAAGVRLRVKSHQKSLPLGGTLSKVVITKLRSGGIRKDHEAFVCMIPGFGVSPELSTMFEAINDKKADGKDMRKAVSVGGEKIARMGDLFERAVERDVEIFKPFYDVMEWKYEPTHITIRTE